MGKFIEKTKKIISEDEMQKIKSHNEHKQYYLNVLDQIGTKEEYIKISRKVTDKIFF